MTTTQLRMTYGLHFARIIKTAASEFSKNYLSEIVLSSRERHVTFVNDNADSCKTNICTLDGFRTRLLCCVYGYLAPGRYGNLQTLA